MKFRYLKNKIRKSVACILALAIVCSGKGLNTLCVSAANTKTYISEIKLITGELTNEVKEKYKGYKFIEKSLSEGGGGPKVHIAYKTTTDANDAIRDIAFMQMKGNYSISAYEELLNQNKELAKINVEQYKAVVSEFKANYNSSNEGKKKLADQAYELLNKYYEEDTGLGMGDFYLNSNGKVTDENYVTLAMQTTSSTKNLLNNILAKAVDTDEDATWLDRLVSYNGFEGLAKANGFNPDNPSERSAALSKFKSEYGDLIMYLTQDVESTDGETTSAWDKFAMSLDEYSKSLDEAVEDYNQTKNENEDASVENIDDALELEETNKKSEGILLHSALYETLSGIEYKDGTLADLFMKTSDEMKEEDFYPIIASLSEGQKVILINCGFAPLITCAGEQIASNAVTNEESVLETDDENLKSETGDTIETIQEQSSKGQLESAEDVIEFVEEEMPDDIADDIIVDDKISVYAGVDRSFFEDNVAMTTKAQDKDSDGAFNNKKSLSIATYITGSLGAAFIIGGVSVLMLANSMQAKYTSALAKLTDKLSIIETAYNDVGKQIAKIYGYQHYHLPYDAKELSKLQDQSAVLSQEYDNLNTRVQAASAKSATSLKIVSGALLVIGLALTTYAIVDAILTLVKKDNPKYTEIPMKMVDTSNGEKKNMEDFLYYNVVQNDTGNAQDLNNWTSGMWLAMYVTKTKSAGAPILFNKDKPEETFKIQDNSNNSAGLKSAHLFGETGAYNMLTYSKNAKSQPKLFMYFEREKEGNTGSIFGNTTVLVSFCLVALAIIALGVVLISKKGKGNKNE